MTTLRTRRFELREVITFAAMAFAFGGALVLMGLALTPHGLIGTKLSFGVARDTYFDVLPIATLVIGFWFNAKRAE